MQDTLRCEVSILTQFEFTKRGLSVLFEDELHTTKMVMQITFHSFFQ